MVEATQTLKSRSKGYVHNLHIRMQQEVCSVVQTFSVYILNWRHTEIFSKTAAQVLLRAPAHLRKLAERAGKVLRILKLFRERAEPHGQFIPPPRSTRGRICCIMTSNISSRSCAHTSSGLFTGIRFSLSSRVCKSVVSAADRLTISGPAASVIKFSPFGLSKYMNISVTSLLGKAMFIYVLSPVEARLWISPGRSRSNVPRWMF